MCKANISNSVNTPSSVNLLEVEERAEAEVREIRTILRNTDKMEYYDQTTGAYINPDDLLLQHAQALIFSVNKQKKISQAVPTILRFM
jgi:hypothetical protein